MTSQSKKDAIQDEWNRVNENIDSILVQLDPDYVKIGKNLVGEGLYRGKFFDKELKVFAAEEYKRAKKENGGFLDPSEFQSNVVNNFTKHYRYRPTRTSISHLKRFFNFLCSRKGNSISSQQLWPETSNPILSPAVVKFMRDCSREFDEKQKKSGK